MLSLKDHVGDYLFPGLSGSGSGGSATFILPDQGMSVDCLDTGEAEKRAAAAAIERMTVSAGRALCMNVILCHVDCASRGVQVGEVVRSVLDVKILQTGLHGLHIMSGVLCFALDGPTLLLMLLSWTVGLYGASSAVPTLGEIVYDLFARPRLLILCWAELHSSTTGCVQAYSIVSSSSSGAASACWLLLAVQAIASPAIYLHACIFYLQQAFMSKLHAHVW
jgi:hypothetical protein